MTNSEKILIFRSLLVILVICNYLVKKYVIDVEVHRFISQRVDGLKRGLTEHINYLSSLD